VRVAFVADASLYAERLGWKVVLLGPKWKLPFLSKEKGGNGVHDASSGPEQIRAWGKICSDGNIAIACGTASDIVVLDVAPRNGGDISIRALGAKGHVLPRGPRAHRQWRMTSNAMIARQVRRCLAGLRRGAPYRRCAEQRHPFGD
jgi:Bifunctional DNA primase/polymerase, N-terminal